MSFPNYKNTFMESSKIFNPISLLLRLLNFQRITLRICKLKITWFLVILSLTSISAQTSLTDPSNKEIEIESFSWFIGKDWNKISEFIENNQRRLRFQNHQFNEIQSILTNEWKFIENQKDGFIYQITVKNKTEKKITAVVWEYNFKDPKTGQTLGNHTFSSRQPIRPNEKKDMFVFSTNPPSSVVSVELLRKNSEKIYLEKVIIKSIEF